MKNKDKKMIDGIAEQSKSNIAFGIFADPKHGNIYTFIKGEESDILALLAMQMVRENDFKKLLFKAVAIYKIAPVQEMINKYEQDS